MIRALIALCTARTALTMTLPPEDCMTITQAGMLAAECARCASPNLPLCRDPVLREFLTRGSVFVEQAATAWLWRFADGSVLTANDAGVVVR